jgi:hypothetical protein
MFTPKGRILLTQGQAMKMVGGLRQFEGNSLRMGVSQSVGPVSQSGESVFRFSSCWSGAGV